MKICKCKHLERDHENGKRCFWHYNCECNAFEEKAKSTKDIPSGMYCYTFTGGVDKVTGFPHTRPCQYWSLRADKPTQENGYCSFLERGDWESDTGGLLWDQVKECGINNEDEDASD